MYPPFLVDGKPPHPPLYVHMDVSPNADADDCRTYHSDFCIECAGWKPMWTHTKELFEPSLSTRSLHVLGRTDCLIIEEQASLLLNSCSNKRIEYHEGGTYSVRTPLGCAMLTSCYPAGHFVPRKDKWQHFFADFIHDPTDSFLVSPSPKVYYNFGLNMLPSTALIDD